MTAQKSKSQLVREMLFSHPNETPTRIAELVSKTHGVDCDRRFVSVIKVQLKKKQQERGEELSLTADPVEEDEVKVYRKVSGKEKTLSELVDGLKQLVAQVGKDEVHRLLEVL